MGVFSLKIKDILDSRKIKFFLLLIIIAAVPLAVYLSQKQQEIRQRASGGPTTAQTCGSGGLDVLIVLDNSGSMSQEGKMGASQQAAKTFVDILSKGAGNMVGLVHFSDDGVLDSPLTSSFSTITNMINNIGPEGGTCTQCGLRKANEEIKAHGRAGIKKVVVLLTDGDPNLVIGNRSQYVSKKYGNFGIPQNAALMEVDGGYNTQAITYYSIGLGKSALSAGNIAFLQKIADLSTGKFFQSPNPSQLTSVFQQIATTIVGRGVVSGSLFNDKNKNARQDFGEEKITNGQVHLKNNKTGQIINVDVDSNGNYQLDGLCNGDYVLSATTSKGTIINNNQPITINDNTGPRTSNFAVQVVDITLTPTPTVSPTLTPTPKCSPPPPVSNVHIDCPFCP